MNYKNQTVRLTEQQLHSLINEAVQEALVQEGLRGGFKGLWNGLKTNPKETLRNLSDTYHQGSEQEEYDKLDKEGESDWNEHFTQAEQAIEQLKQFYSIYRGKGILNTSRFGSCLAQLRNMLNTADAQKGIGYNQDFKKNAYRNYRPGASNAGTFKSGYNGTVNSTKSHVSPHVWGSGI